MVLGDAASHRHRETTLAADDVEDVERREAKRLLQLVKTLRQPLGCPTLGDSEAEGVVQTQRLRLALDREEVQEALGPERNDRLEPRLDRPRSRPTVRVSLPHAPAVVDRSINVGVLEIDAVAKRQRVVREGIEREQQAGVGVCHEHEREIDPRWVESEWVARLAPLLAVDVAVADLGAMLVGGTVPRRDLVRVEDVRVDADALAIRRFDADEQRSHRRPGRDEQPRAGRGDRFLHEGVPRCALDGRVDARVRATGSIHGRIIPIDPDTPRLGGG